MWYPCSASAAKWGWRAHIFVTRARAGEIRPFLTAGAVTEATGARVLSPPESCWRKMPLLAGGQRDGRGLMSAMPLTIGFFKDELFFAAAHHGSGHGGLRGRRRGDDVLLSRAVLVGIFGGPDNGEVTPAPVTLTGPIVVLGAISLIGGIWPEPFANSPRRRDRLRCKRRIVPPCLSPEWTTENGMAVAAIGIGWRFLFAAYLVQDGGAGGALRGAVWTGARLSRRRADLKNLSDRIHWIEVRDLRSRVATVLAPAALMVVITLIFTNADAPSGWEGSRRTICRSSC